MRRAALVLAVLVVAAGCGDDDDDATTTTSAPTATTAAEEVAVTLVDYAFEDLPSSVAAGTSLRVVNDSTEELHELVAFAVPDGVELTAADVGSMAPPDVIGALGEPVTVLIGPPAGGAMITAVGDGTLTESGRYVVACFIPTGADPQAYLDAAANSDGPPQVPGGPPHYTQGMVADLEVR